ncbi:MAG TPA: DUF4019 domain-containing protein [Arenimonas sp.]|nr:DUF4019 domain-containing protein [Arenimonas sp.]
MYNRTPLCIHACKILFIFTALTALSLPAVRASSTIVPVIPDSDSSAQLWQPSEQDQLKVKLLSYQFLNAKDNGDFDAAYAFYSENTKSPAAFKTWKYDQLVFNATAGALIDRSFTRISWYESSPDNALPGVFASVDYSSIFTNIDMQCGMLMWHKKEDGNFELIRDQNNFIDKSSQAKLSEIEISETKTKFGCKDLMSPE